MKKKVVEEKREIPGIMDKKKRQRNKNEEEEVIEVNKNDGFHEQREGNNKRDKEVRAAKPRE